MRVMIATGSPISVEPEVLIGFDLLLVVVDEHRSGEVLDVDEDDPLELLRR